MNVVPLSPSSRQNLARGAAGVAGVAVALTVLASVTGLFGQASSMPWLADTPANVAALEPCRQIQATAARHVCVEEVISKVLSRDASTRLAQAGGHGNGRISAR
jgi:hypothetical protein